MAPRPDLHPDTANGLDQMRRLQTAVADAARFASSTTLDATDRIAGVDQAFPHAEAVVSAAVVLEDGAVVEEATARRTPPIGYVPGLLAFREGAAAIAAIDALDDDPAAILVDGNGRIHQRQAGLATHLGVVLDRPTVGVAKSLLCGQPDGAIDDLDAGDRVPIRAGHEIDAPNDTIVGFAVQTRQFDGSAARINPVIVSPGHRVDADGAADLVEATLDGYKLPAPIRHADSAASRATERPKG